jgi:Fur family ferric uptake transcriptional regulator
VKARAAGTAEPQRSSEAAGLAAELRARGYRLTPPRQLVLDAVAELGHATPDAVAATVRDRASGVTISTVYRTLELLEELGLVTHTHLGHGAPTYHAAGSGDHVHLVCQACGRVTEAGPDLVAGLARRLAAEEGFAADVRHLAIFGRCADCQVTIG